MKSLFTQARAFAEPPTSQNRGEFPVNSRFQISTDGEHGLRNDRNPDAATKIILVPLTLARGTRPALIIAKKLAHESNAKLVLLHVVQLNIAGEERGIQRTRLLNELCRNAEAQLQQLADGMGGQVSTEILVCQGRPAEAIVDAAKRLQADTVVMYKHNYRNWLGWLHRNTARAVLRQVACRTCLVIQAKPDSAVSLLIADHAAGDQLSERRAFPENQNPSRSLFRVLFS